MLGSTPYTRRDRPEYRVIDSLLCPVGAHYVVLADSDHVRSRSLVECLTLYLQPTKLRTSNLLGARVYDKMSP